MTTVNEKPKHKPSTSHTLDEVLHSLQDLIRNDLLSEDVAAPPPQVDTPTAARRPGRPRKPRPVASDTPDQAPRRTHRRLRQEPSDLDEVIRSLKGLISEELGRGGATVAESTASPGTSSPVGASRSPSPAGVPTGPQPLLTAPRPPLVPPQGLQQAFRFEAEPASTTADAGAVPPQAQATAGNAGHETTTPPPIERPVDTAALDADQPPTAGGAEAGAAAPVDAVTEEIAAHSPALQDAHTELASLADELDTGPRPDDPSAPEDSVTAGDSAGADAAPEHEGADEAHWNDVPVLEDIVLRPSGETGGHADPARLRQLAVRVVARLNIERRRAGEPPLDVRTVARLQRFVREELERLAATVQNNAPTD